MLVLTHQPLIRLGTRWIYRPYKLIPQTDGDQQATTMNTHHDDATGHHDAAGDDIDRKVPSACATACPSLPLSLYNTNSEPCGESNV